MLTTPTISTISLRWSPFDILEFSAGIGGHAKDHLVQERDCDEGYRPGYYGNDSRRYVARAPASATRIIAPVAEDHFQHGPGAEATKQQQWSESRR